MKAAIKGVGIDVAMISRYNKFVSSRLESRFVARVLHREESKTYYAIPLARNKAQFLASRYALVKV